MRKFAKVFEQKDKVFMIYIILHWKDDSKPLKQIYFIDLETMSNLYWIIIIYKNQINLLKIFILCC